LHDDGQDLFAYAQEINFQDVAYDFAQTIDKNHGRLEIRRHWTISDPEFISFLGPQGKWPHLHTIGMVEAQRLVADKNSSETRYYISSLDDDDASKFGLAVRSHWQIENKVHLITANGVSSFHLTDLLDEPGFARRD